MHRAVALIAVLATAVPACTMTPGAKHTTMGIGAVTAIGGAIASGYIASRPVSQDWTGAVEEIGLAFELMMALAVTGVGIGVFAAGAAAETPSEVSPLAGAVPGYAYGHDYVSAAPGSVIAADGSRTSVTSISLADEELPVLPTSPAALQLAGQVRAMVRDGHCDAARNTFARLELADVAYAHAMANGPIMQACRP